MCRNPLDKKGIFIGSIFEPSQEELDRMSADIMSEMQPNKRTKLNEDTGELSAGGRLGSSSKGKVVN